MLLTSRPVSQSVSFVAVSFVAVPPHSTHHRLNGRLRTPRSTQVLSTRSLGSLHYASEVGLSQRAGCVPLPARSCSQAPASRLVTTCHCSRVPAPRCRSPRTPAARLRPFWLCNKFILDVYELFYYFILRDPQPTPAGTAPAPRAVWSGVDPTVERRWRRPGGLVECRVCAVLRVGAGTTAEGGLARLGPCEEPRPRIQSAIRYFTPTPKSSQHGNVEAPLDRM